MTSRLRMAAAVGATTVAAICRAMNHPLRLDIPPARAFYGDYLELP